MKEEVLTYQVNEEGLSGEIVLTITRANVRVGMQRSILQVDAARENRATQDLALKVLRAVTYPDLMAPVVNAVGKLVIEGDVINLSEHWPMLFEDFILLPDDLISKWEMAVYRLNPHWNPAGQPDQETEKKD